MEPENQEKKLLSQQEIILRTISEQLAAINKSTVSSKIDLSEELEPYTYRVSSHIYSLEGKVHELMNSVKNYAKDYTQNFNTVQNQIIEFNRDHRNNINDLIRNVDKVLISDKQKKLSTYTIVIMSILIIALVTFSIYSIITVRVYEKRAFKYEYMKYLGDNETQYYIDAVDSIFLESNFSELKKSINIKKDEIQEKFEAAELANEKENQAERLSNEAEQIRKQAEKGNK